MKKHIYKLIGITILLFSLIQTKAQTFVEASTSLFTTESNDLTGSVKSVFEFHAQIGKFSSNKKMRSFSLNFRSKVLIDRTETAGNFTSDNRIASRVIAVGYERKGLFANTEFDDIWQFYNIVNYHVSFTSFTPEFSDPQAQEKFGYGRLANEVAIDIDLGLGVGRKITNNLYVNLDARGYFPLLDFEGDFMTGAGLKLNLGARYFF